MAYVGNGLDRARGRWDFVGTSESFDAHVSASVPMYAEGHDLCVTYSDFFCNEGAFVLDIGCSTGTLLAKLMDRHASNATLRALGIDPVTDMVELAQARLAHDERVAIEQSSLPRNDLGAIDFAISFLTLQFIPPRYRQQVVDEVWEALNWGGGLFVFEKVRAPDARFQDYANQIYHHFKLERGFQPSEILARQASLTGVLEPFSTEGNLGLFERAGFTDIMTVMKWVNFEAYLAIK